MTTPNSPSKCPVCGSPYFGPLYTGKEHIGRYCKGWPSGYDRSYDPCRGGYKETFVAPIGATEGISITSPEDPPEAASAEITTLRAQTEELTQERNGFSELYDMECGNHKRSKERLASSQAREQQLREALQVMFDRFDPSNHQTHCECEPAVGYVCGACHFASEPKFVKAKQLLAITSDTTALDQIKAGYEARIQQLREALKEIATNATSEYADAWCGEIATKALALPSDTTALIRACKLYAAEVLDEIRKDVCQATYVASVLDAIYIKSEQLRKEAGE